MGWERLWSGTGCLWGLLRLIVIGGGFCLAVYIVSLIGEGWELLKRAHPFLGQPIPKLGGDLIDWGMFVVVILYLARGLPDTVCSSVFFLFVAKLVGTALVMERWKDRTPSITGAPTQKVQTESSNGFDAPTETNVTTLRSIPYDAYLKTEHWARMREKALDYAGHRCQLCYSASEPLHVHHRTYDRLGRELLSDLVVLCEDCHERFHIPDVREQ